MQPKPLLLGLFLALSLSTHATDVAEALSRELIASRKPWLLRADEPEQHSRVLNAPAGQVLDIRPYGALTVHAQRTERTLSGLRLRWVLHTRLGLYQSTLAVPVSNAAVATISVQLAPGLSNLVPVGHQKPWDDLAATHVERIELRAECVFSASAAEPLTLTISKIEASPRKPAAVQPQLLDAALLPAPPGLNAAAEIRFRLDPLPADPFADEGEGDVSITLPDRARSLAFIDQPFSKLSDGSATRAIPAGLSYYRAFLAQKPERGTLTIKSGSHTWEVDIASLPQLQASASEAEDVPPRWKPLLTEALPLLSEHALPVLPTTLKDGRFQSLERPLPSETGWRPIPFWNAGWGGFYGYVWPNLDLAARLDAELLAASTRGEKRPFILFDGAVLERNGAFNWSNHPLQDVLKGPGEIYRVESGEHFARRWMRYALARWGRSKAASEFWLTQDALAPGDTVFFKRLAPLLTEWTNGLDAKIFALHPFAAEGGPTRTVATFDGTDSAIWYADVRQGASGGARTSEGTDGAHGFELRARNAAETTIGLTADFNRVKTLWSQSAPDNFAAEDTLLFDVQIPADAPADLRLGIHLRDRDGLWYQTLLPGMPTPGDWTGYALDIGGRNAHGLKAVNHEKTWTDYSRQRVSEIGIHLYSTHKNFTPVAGGPPQSLRALIDHVRVVKRPELPAPAPVITLLRQAFFRGGAMTPIEASQAAIGDLYKCDVTINRAFENPFDPTSCDLTALIETPSGKKVRVPFFFNQTCERSESQEDRSEIVVPYGTEYFTLRYRILESGPHKVSIELREGGKYETKRQWVADQRYSPDGKAQAALGRGRGGSRYAELFENGRRPVDTVVFVPGTVAAKIAAPAFDAGKPAKPFRGFVRVAEDRRHFQFDDGSFYYPLGPCVRSPSDRRIAYNADKFAPDEVDRIGHRGTYQYDDYFAAYQKSGINWARVWMCSWWGALEWRRDWPGFQGLGRYNLLNAWRIDHMLAQAERSGVYISLCLTNHGQFSLYVDAEWENNPYSARLGGPLTTAGEFFSRGEAKILHQNKLRYILARYGHSPAIANWALFSELEWTEEFEPSLRQNGADLPAPVIEQWHTEMANFLRENDPNRHLTLTHFSHPKNGESVLLLPAVDIAASNAYSAFPDFGSGRFDAAFSLASFWSGYPDTELKGFDRFGKPALVEEQGRHWMGGRNNTPRDLRADLHAQLWGGVMQPLAGATGYWWWVQLHVDNWYEEYASLSRFLENEDFRPAKGETLLEPAYRGVPARDGELYGRALKSNQRLYAWVYHPSVPRGGEPGVINGGQIRVGGLVAGDYEIEFWDTYKGEVISKRPLKIALEDGKPASTLFELPPVQRDMAVKVKPVKR